MTQSVDISLVIEAVGLGPALGFTVEGLVVHFKSKAWVLLSLLPPSGRRRSPCWALGCLEWGKG